MSRGLLEVSSMHIDAKDFHSMSFEVKYDRVRQRPKEISGLSYFKKRVCPGNSLLMKYKEGILTV